MLDIFLGGLEVAAFGWLVWTLQKKLAQLVAQNSSDSGK
jgi:hypothetical protein